jgi:acetyl-CoA carboxylase carboxyltransferase component
MALKTGAPIIGINDSGGARIQEGVDSLHGYGQIFFRNTRCSGVIPQISVIVGPCAGGAVYSPALTDFIFMVNKVSQMYITGPSIIKAVTAEDVTAEEIGGAYSHNAISGNGHFICENELECFKSIRELLSFIPSNNLDDAPHGDSEDDVNRKEASLNTLVPTNAKMPYDVRELIRRIVDNGGFYEVMPLFAQNMVIGFSRLAGQAIGIIANQPNVLAGCLDINSSDKAARFIRFCDSFNMPILTIVDTPGFLPGKNQEFGGIIRHGAKLLYAYSEATVPKVTLTVRKSYGGASVAMCNKDLGADYVVAWPQAEIAVMGADGAVPLIFKRDIEGAADPVAKKKELIEKYEQVTCNPYEAAQRGLCDFVIAPENTRPFLASLFSTLRTKRESVPNKKHGNIPL